MASEFGDVFIAAIAAAISPVPIIAAILVLFSDHGRRNGILYLLGWVAGMLICIGAVLLLPEDLDFNRGAVLATAGAGLRILIGLLFVVAALAVWIRRPKTGEAHPLPAWTNRIAGLSGLQALLLAIGLAVINPKNLALAFSTILSIVEAQATPWEARLALALFVLIGSSTIAVPVFYRLIAGKQADRQLQTWKEWLTYNNATVVCVVLLMMGVMIIGKGVGGLL
jgi:threonine/homoserine/homoserine lactone efflux protein